MRALVIALLWLWPAVAGAEPVDCSDVYGGKPTKCEPTACDVKYQAFLGTWKGPFQAYVKELSKDGKQVFRPYDNTTSYVASDCLKNPGNGETFIVGHMTNDYPAFSGLPAHTEHSLLITGRDASNAPFLRQVQNKDVSTFQLEYKNAAAELAVWTFTLPGHGGSPEMLFTIIDGRDVTALGADKRNVTMTLRIGPKDHPYFDGMFASGFHTRQP